VGSPSKYEIKIDIFCVSYLKFKPIFSFKTMFKSLETFDKTHRGNVLRAYADILTCVNLKMWYDLDKGQKVPQLVFDVMLENGDIVQYSKNPEHPVFGEDVGEYESGLGSEIISMASDLGILVADLVFTIKEVEEGEKEFARAMYLRTPELLLALTVHPQFGPTLRRSFWEELIRYEAQVLHEKAIIPPVLHLDRRYLDMMLPRPSYYEESIPESMRDVEMRGLVIQIASEQRFGQEMTVVLKKPTMSHSYTVVLGRNVGYEVQE
jgi:hypothetical protein